MNSEQINNVKVNSVVNSENAVDKSLKPIERKVFDSVFSDKELEFIDSNKDGSVSILEVKNYINSNTSNDEVLNKIANIMGIELTSSAPIANNYEFKSTANKILDSLIKIDTEQNNDITISEIDSAENLTEEEKVLINKMFGLADGKINNKQGRFGSCWALAAAYGVSIANPEMFKQVVKRDEEGNVLVTFYGLKDEPFVSKIDRHVIQGILKSRTRLVNSNMQNGYISSRQYYSSDPDAVAVELAFQNFDNYIEKLKREQKENILDYVKNSEPIPPEKPSLDLISKDMTNDDLEIILNYYKNSDCENKENYLIPYDVEYLNDEILENIKQYIERSTPITPEKPTEKDCEHNYQVLSNYIKNSDSKTVQKPKLYSYYNNVGSVSEGGFPGNAIKLMLGGTLDSYKGYNYDNSTGEYTKLSKQQRNQLVSILQDKGTLQGKNKVYSIAFRDSNNELYSHHAYTVVDSDDKYIYLVNPHDTNAEPIPYPINKAIKNLSILQINTLPNQLA